MRRTGIGAWALFAVLACSSALTTAARAGDDDVPVEERARIAGWIALLDDADAETRVRAEKELLAAGLKVRPQLETARADAGAEARRRIDALLRRLDELGRTGSAEEWPALRGGPQRAGVVGSVIPREEPSLAWRVDVPDRTPLQGALLATSSEVVALSASGAVRCFRAEDGGRRWLAHVEGGVAASGAAALGRLVVPTGRGAVALDLGDGHEVWRLTGDYGCRATPAVVGARCWVALRNRGVFGVDVRTGEVAVERKLAPQGALLADADLLVTGTEDGRLHSLDPETGKDRWRTDLGSAPVMGPTLAAPGIIVVMTHDRGLTALSTSNGRTLWQVRAAALSPSESLAAAAGRVFVTGADGSLRAYDAATGRALWNRHEGFVEMGAPAATADAVCFGSRGRLTCRDAESGDFLWRIDVDRSECSSPVVAGGRIFVLDAGQLRCLR